MIGKKVKAQSDFDINVWHQGEILDKIRVQGDDKYLLLCENGKVVTVFPVEIKEILQ